MSSNTKVKKIRGPLTPIKVKNRLKAVGLTRIPRCYSWSSRFNSATREKGSASMGIVELFKDDVVVRVENAGDFYDVWMRIKGDETVIVGTLAAPITKQTATNSNDIYSNYYAAGIESAKWTLSPWLFPVPPMAIIRLQTAFSQAGLKLRYINLAEELDLVWKPGEEENSEVTIAKTVFAGSAWREQHGILLAARIHPIVHKVVGNAFLNKAIICDVTEFLATKEEMAAGGFRYAWIPNERHVTAFKGFINHTLQSVKWAKDGPSVVKI